MSDFTSEPLSPSIKANFETLTRAFRNNDVAIVASRDAKTGEPVTLLCAMQKEDDDEVTIVPFAIMIDGNPYEMFVSPLEEK